MFGSFAHRNRRRLGSDSNVGDWYLFAVAFIGHAILGAWIFAMAIGRYRWEMSELLVVALAYRALDVLIFGPLDDNEVTGTIAAIRALFRR